MPVYSYRYRVDGGPGCSGCLFVFLLVMLATGGLPFVVQFLGFLAAAFLSGLLFLAVAFYAFGYYVRRQIAAYERSQTEAQHRFVTLLIHILVHVARLDGTVSRAETRIITDFFRQHLGYDQQRIYWVKEVIRQAVDSNAGLDELLREFKESFAYEPRLILLELVLRIVATKVEPPPAELELARRIANFLDISYYDQQVLFARFRAQAAGSGGPAVAAVDEARYYAVLGLEPGSGFAAVKQAYRKLSMQYHPDKVAHLGEEFRKVAEEKMKEINEAYQYFRKKYGQ